MTTRDPPAGTLDGWPAAAVAGGLLLTLLVPSPLLTLLHMNYEAPSGAAWEKVHPGSDLLMLGIVAGALASGQPRRWALARLRRFPGTALYLAITAFLTVYLVAVLGDPFTPFIDTFVVPAFVLVAVVDLRPAWKGRVELALHLFVALNAVVGITEFVTGGRLIPVVLSGIEQTTEVEARAFGLLGHPLSSAAMAGLYAVALMCGGGRRLPQTLRLPALGLQFLALGAFGGRVALVMTLACVVVAVLASILRMLAGRQMDILHVGIGFLVAPLLIAAAGGVAASGFFDTVLNRFVEDNGSAAARHAILEVFDYLSWPDLLFGPDQDRLASVQHLIGIEVGVESFWFGFILAYGLLPSLVFFAGFGFFMADIMRRCSPAAWALLLFFVGVISTSLSLSAKTTMLGQFVAVMVILVPRGLPTQARRRVSDFVPALS